MYSIVMLAAMTGAPEAPDFFCCKKSASYGCCGGCTGTYTSCCGGGCCGGGYGGCCGGWGCHGIPTVGYSCCGGCCGGCYGGLAFSGCCGGYAMPAPGVGYTVPPAPVTVGFAPVPATRAQVLVRAPAESKLYADGQATTLTGAERVFQTPELVAGKDYQYTLKIEYTEGTETKSATKQVVVRAGTQSVVDFTATGPEKATSPVTVTLPEKAKLFVDGSATSATGGTQSFRTPELNKGKPYVYQFRAEVESNGRTEVLTREVTFNAGEPIVVDFTTATGTRTASK